MTLIHYTRAFVRIGLASLPLDIALPAVPDEGKKEGQSLDQAASCRCNSPGAMNTISRTTMWDPSGWLT